MKNISTVDIYLKMGRLLCFRFATDAKGIESIPEIEASGKIECGIGINVPPQKEKQEPIAKEPQRVSLEDYSNFTDHISP